MQVRTMCAAMLTAMNKLVILEWTAAKDKNA